MYHGLTNDFLCSACRLNVFFKDDIGKEKSGTGTAFFVGNEKNEMCLITNRHLIDINYKEKTGKYKNFKIDRITIDLKDKDPNTNLPTISEKLILLNYNDFIFSSIYENDVACLKNIEVHNASGKTETKLEYWIPFELLANKERLSQGLTICDLVAFPGFPEWHDKRNNLPILRTGTIASDPRFDYSFTGDFDGECIAYEAFSFSGSSGSPVFAIRKGVKVGEGLTNSGFRELMLIGINAGHLPIEGVFNSHSGISYLFKSSIILDLIK